MSVTAIVPIKALSTAKGRLSESLKPAQRQAFVAWMAARVLRACGHCDGIAHTLVVAGDDAAAQIARDAGVAVMVVPEPGLAVALSAADAATSDREATVIVAADLPQATAEDLQAVLDAGLRSAGVVIAPTTDGGTGVLYRRPPGVITTAYGPGSADAHAALAAAAGVRALVVDRPGLAADVDTPDQLPVALALASESDVGSGPRAVGQPTAVRRCL